MTVLTFRQHHTGEKGTERRRQADELHQQRDADHQCAGLQREPEVGREQAQRGDLDDQHRRRRPEDQGRGDAWAHGRRRGRLEG